jgi:translocation and assembly module TamB
LFPDAEVKGLISGEARGNLLKGGIVDLTARTNSLNGCAVVVRGAKGAFAIQVQSVSAEAAWRGEDVRGDVSLVLTNYGKAKGSFVLPVPARLPFRLVPSGPIDIVLQARMRERGLISALMPGIARETEGRLDVNARANGTWEYPRLSGGARLTEAGAYIPQAGITLKNLNLVTEFSEDQVRITSFRVESGPGNLQGEGTIRLDAWRIAGYEGVLKGDSFQAVFLPEIRGQVTPDLTVEGSLKEVTVRGDVRIPRLQIFDTVGENVVRPSPDVVIVDAETDKKKRGLPFAVDVKVQVHLGDQVSIRMRGLDARLGGRLAVSAAGAEDVSVQGKINVVKGSYKAYGVDLQITRGNIIFTGPPERPTLDVQASRQVEDVVAGVEVTGTASNPVVNLYSRPPLPDSDKLAYIVLGRPLRGDAAQSAILMQAASTLISRGAGGDKGTGIEERLKGMLGLDVLQFGPATTGFGTAAGTAAVGTGPIGTPASPGTLPTQTATSPAGDAASTAVTLGRYLSPKLYISFGRSLFTNQNLVILRYTLTRNIEVETRTGTESGADIFYKIQFD